MKLSNQVQKDLAATTDIPLSGLPLTIAKAELKYNGFYGYTRADLNQKILLIS